MTSKLIAWLMGAIGVIGTVASIAGVQSGPVHVLLLGLFILCLVAAGLLFISSQFSLLSAYKLQNQCNHLGIRRIFTQGKLRSVSEMPKKLPSSKTIRIMAVSGQALVKAYKSEFVRALKNAAVIKVLTAKPQSQFVSDVESAESPTRLGQIGPEIVQVEALLTEYLLEAKRDLGPNGQPGRVFVGHFSTHLRASITIADDQWGWLTPNFPSKRSVETPSFELIAKPHGLLRDCLTHFDMVWELTEKVGAIKEI